jgi:thioester reductase-like protein
VNQTVFLTGFPGFIASGLLRRLSPSAGRFIVLVQTDFVKAAESGISELVQQTGRAADDFCIVPGDITLPDLGMSPSDQEMVRSEATIVFHLAAIYDLAVARKVALRVNFEGTRNVNHLARSLSNLVHYHYVSTCYVAGKRTGPIRETELQHDAGFRNNYEESKYLAEREVEALKGELPITIHRPSVVCGDSRTGETAKYDGVYYLIHYLLKWPQVLSRFNIGNTDVSLNLVPVDFVVNSLAALTNDASALGKTLQLADPNPPSTRELFNAIAESISGHQAAITVPASLVRFTLMLPLSPRITGLPYAGVPYFFLKQSYDTTQAQQLLGAHRIECPPFKSYVDRIVAYAATHRVPA